MAFKKDLFEKARGAIKSDRSIKHKCKITTNVLENQIKWHWVVARKGKPVQKSFVDWRTSHAGLQLEHVENEDSLT